MIDFTYNSIILTDYKSQRERTSLRSLSLAGDFCFFMRYASFQASTAAFIHSGIDIHSATTAMLIYSAYVIRCLPRLLFVC